LDADGLGGLLVIEVGEDVADGGLDDLIGVLWHGGAPCADSPDWLVGQDNAARLLGGDAGEGPTDLRTDKGDRLPSLVLLKALPDAHDGGQPMVQGGLQLAVDRFVGLSEVLTAFRVADDDVLRQLLHHEGGDLSGVGALILPVHVLGSDPDVGPFQYVSDGRDGGRRGTDGQLHRADVCQRRFQCRRQLNTLRDSLVHFPVSSDKWRPHTLSSSLSQ